MKESTKTILWIVSPVLGIITYTIVFYLFAILIGKSGMSSTFDENRYGYSQAAANFLLVFMYFVPSAFGFWVMFTVAPLVSKKIGRVFLLAIPAFTLVLALISLIGCGNASGLISGFCWEIFIIKNYELVGITFGLFCAYLFLRSPEKEIEKYRPLKPQDTLDSDIN